MESQNSFPGTNNENGWHARRKLVLAGGEICVTLDQEWDGDPPFDFMLEYQMKIFHADGFYSLLDFGNGRRLERFGEIVLDRPCPIAEKYRSHAGNTSAEPWKTADARFLETSGPAGNSGGRGNWEILSEKGELVFKGWSVSPSPDESNNRVVFELKGTPFGHIGIFPEQLDNWNRISKYCEDFRGARVLNLFAYTGGSTLAAAAAGAETTHLDAAKNIVQWARRNAGLSNLANAPIRWIAEDARKFLKRELKRGNRYDLIILDPPSYGHGAHGEVWRISKHLPGLLYDCFTLLEDSAKPAILLTWHTGDYGHERPEREIFSGFPGSGGAKIESFEIALTSVSGASLPCGRGIAATSRPLESQGTPPQ